MLWFKELIGDFLQLPPVNSQLVFDKEYCTMLDEVWRGSSSTSTIQKLEERLLQVSAVEKFEELQQASI